VYIKCSGKYYYIVFASRDIKQRVCWALIEETETEALKNGGFTASSKLPQLFKHYNDPNNDKLQQLQNEVDKAIEVQSENVTKILSNQVKLNDLITSTEELKTQGEDFERGGRKLKNKMRLRLFIIILILVLVVLGIAALLIIILCATLIPQSK